MNQQKKKSKAIMKVLFVFLAILVLALIGAIVYFYLTGEILQTEEEETITCGCYYIDPQVTSTCGDTKRAFKFNTTEGTLQDCSASCPISDLSANMLYSTTPQESYLTCKTRNIPSTRCNSMQITTESGLIVTGKIPPNESITVTATFDSTDYQDHQFLINNIPTEPDEVNENAISKTISELGEESTLQISAQAVDSRGDTVSSIICNRLIEVTTTAKAGVSELVLDTYTEGTLTKIRSAVISAGGLQDTETSLNFSFKNDTLTMTEGFEIDPSRGRITVEQEDLYDSSNYSGSNSFSLLNNYQGDIEISVEVIQDSNSLGSAIANITLLEDEVVDYPDTEEPDTEEPETEEPSEEPTEEPITEDEITASSFSVSKTTAQTCVERVSPNNSTAFTITVTNNSETADTIESVKDKLPLGFTYVPSSSKLNGDAISDSVFVTTTEIGDSQEIVWEPQDSWSISSNGTLTIAFDATAGSQALSGDNLNEVIVTPSEIPDDPSTLRTSVGLTVAQDCDDIDTSTPQTGLFDTTLGRIAFGIGIILVGIIIHNTSQGNRLAHMIINSGAYRDAEMTSYKFFNPKKYFEEKILERRERKR